MLRNEGGTCVDSTWDSWSDAVAVPAGLRVAKAPEAQGLTGVRVGSGKPQRGVADGLGAEQRDRERGGEGIGGAEGGIDSE